MPPLTPHVSLVFNGQCEAAFRHYADCLDGTIVFMLTWAASPMAADAPPDWGNKILHASLKIGDTVMNGADMPPDRYKAPQGFAVMLDMTDPAVAERVFETLAKDARIEMPLQETFWASRYALLTDRFGIPWEINCGRPEAPTSTT
jgi:PhnB protein